MEKHWDVFVYGDVNVDLIVSGVEKIPAPGQEEFVGEIPLFVGGGAALTALGMAKLGLAVAFQGAVGDDLYGRFIREQFCAVGVNDSLLQTSKEEGTGISISFTGPADRSFLTYPGTNRFLNLAQMDPLGVRKAQHIHVTGYTADRHEEYRRQLERMRKETSATVSFDLGWDGSGIWTEKIYELLPMIDVLFMNETEAIHYGRTATAKDAAAKFARFCKLTAVKMGDKGAIAYQNGSYYEASGYRVKVVDTTGAGDSFNAGFLYGFLDGREIGECLECGNAAGACSVTAAGGNTAFPDERKLWKLIQDGRRRG